MAVAIRSLFQSCSNSSALAHSHHFKTSLRMLFSNWPAAAATGSKFLPSSRCNNSVQRKMGPVTICTNPDSVDVEKLRALLAATGQNCEQFPSMLNNGTIVPVDPRKLRCALRHSTVVVALYVDVYETGEDSRETPPQQLDGLPGLGWLNYWMPRSAGKKTLVAFGRATSDHTLTASIYDLVVAPSYQRLGYGRQVLRRIVRDLRRRGISDIAVTPSPALRLFFQNCGFAPDILKSITMMYTRSPSSPFECLQIKEYGRKSLLIPPPLRVFQDGRNHHLY